ncbi:MAG: alpha/beta fold hydrolase, partial [Candidatus Krumholzibacteria bacterium]
AGTSPSQVRFSADGAQVYFHWNSPEKLDSLNALEPEKAYEHYMSLEEEAGTYALTVASGQLRKLTDEEADTLVASEGAWSKDRTRRAEIRAGDVYLVDVAAGGTRRITATLAREQHIQISGDGKTVYYQSGDNLFSVTWSGGPIRQRTDLITEDEPGDEELSKQRQFLVDQQKELFWEFQQEKKEPRKKRPQAVYLGKGWSVDDVRVSPTGHYAAVEISKKPEGARKPLVPHFVTESGYIETKETRPMVGDKGGANEIRLIDLRGDSLLPVKMEDDMIANVMSWSPVEDILLARGITNDYKKRFFYAVEADVRGADGQVVPRVLDEYADAAWVGGPAFFSTGGWLPGGSAIYFISEEEGYAHLYTVTKEGLPNKLTDGPWEVYEAHPSRDGSLWYLITNEGDPSSQRMWTMNADGTGKKVLVEDIGKYDPKLSGDEATVAYTRSTVNAPPELYLYDMASGGVTGPLTTSSTKLFRGFPWIRPETITINASDGGRFRAHIFRPETFGKRANHAGVIFIHGAGYLQNVTDWWSYYYREYMFNHYLALNGYTVLNVDFRGSAGYGRESRVAVHRHMGGRDLDDVIDAARYVVKKEGVDKDKVGVYGGSYGGFLTIMALFKYPDVITCGGAIRSVTDWAHYNHWYTSRILGTPEDDPEAFEQSSPINFAEGFEGGLLMLHGLVDANVLATDVLRLSQKLIELGKDDWDLILYPVEPHSFKRASSWTDEYKRIFNLFEEELVGR